MQELMEVQRQDNKVVGLVHHTSPFKPCKVQKLGKATIIRLPILGKFVFAPITFSGFWYLPALIKRLKPNAIHLHVPNTTAFILLFFPSARRTPWVVHWHADVIGDAPDWRLTLLYPVYRLFEKALLTQAVKIIVTSPDYLKTSVPLVGFEHKCQVIPLALKNASPAEKANKNADTKMRAALEVLCIGRFTYYKGHIHLLEAVRECIEAGLLIKLTLVGNGELLGQYKEWILNNDLTEQISIRTKLNDDELLCSLQRADLVCLPSIERTEAFGVVLLEAMRAAKPCICTDITGSGMSFVVEHEKTGLIVKASNSEAIQDALKKYAGNPELLLEHGLAGKKRFELLFDLDVVKKEWQKVYDSI